MINQYISKSSIRAYFIEHQLLFLCIDASEKPIHLRSHAWQASSAVLTFALKITMCYEKCNGHYIVLARVYLVYFNVKNQ